jgi:hypothetical protein
MRSVFDEKDLTDENSLGELAPVVAGWERTGSERVQVLMLVDCDPDRLLPESGALTLGVLSAQVTKIEGIGELPIDLEEDKVARAVGIGLVAEMERK